MTTKEITFIFVFSVLLVKAQSDLEGCWKKESNTISFVTPTSPQLVSSSEAYFYLYANTPTSLNLQSGNEVWEISPASVDYTKNYSVVRKLNLKGEFTPYLFHSIYDLRSGGYFITNSNLRNGSRSSPDLTQGFTNPKVEAYGVPDTTNSFFLVQRNSASGDAMLVSEVSLKSELPNVIKSFGVKYDATSFDIYAEVFESSLTGATTKTMYILANNNGKMSIELFSYSKLTPDQHISATLGYEAQNDFKILGSDNTQLFFAIKNFKTTFVDILSVPKNAIVSGAIVQPKLIVSLASSSSTIEVSDIRKDNTVTIALNNNAKGNAIDVVNINLTTSERIQLPSIPTLSATQPYALDVSKKGITRIALMIKGNSFDIYKFVVAPSLPKPVVDKVFAVDTARKLDVPMVNRRNYYTHCGAFTYEQYAKVAFKNLPPDVDTLITGRSTSISKDDAPNMFSANRFQIYNGSFITDFSFQYRNACWRSDTVNIKMVSQVFNLTENGALATAYCENTSSALNIPTSLVWPNVLFNYPTIMEPDTFIVTSMSTPPSTTKYAGALNVSQIPYTADVSSLSFNIRKLATSILGCSSSSKSQTITLYKNPDPAKLSLRKALAHKILIPTVNGSISDTLYYFLWDNRSIPTALLPSLDDRLGMLGRYHVGGGSSIVASGKSFAFSVDTSLASVGVQGKTVDLKLQNFNNAVTFSRGCSTEVNYRFLLKKISFDDLRLEVVGDSVIKPGNLYTFGIYSKGLNNRLSGGNYKFKWNVQSPAGSMVGPRWVELADTVTVTNLNKVLGKSNGTYVLKIDIYVVLSSGEKKIGTVYKSFQVRSPAVIVTQEGTTIDPNRLGSNLCKVDTFMCSGLYLRNISLSNLNQTRETCTNTPTVDNTSDTSKFIRVYTDEDYQLTLLIGNEYSTTGKDSASVVVVIDYDNDGEIGEVGEVFVSAYLPVTSLSVINKVPNKLEYIGDKRLSVILSDNELTSKTDLCNLINEAGAVQEDFLIHIESPLSLQVSSFVTPNGDGKNDLLEVRGVDERYPTLLHVYNKFGAIVYQKAGFGTSDYKSDGFEKNLKPDTYYYVFENGHSINKGFFEVR